MKSERLRSAVLNLAVTAIYAASAKLGLTLAFVAEHGEGNRFYRRGFVKSNAEIAFSPLQ